MRNTLWLGVMLVFVAGCGEQTHERIAKGAVAALDDMATSLEEAKTAGDAKPKLEAALARLKALKKEEDAAGPPSKAVSDSLKKKYDPEIQKVNARIQSAIAQLGRKDPAGLVTLLPVFTEMSQLDKK